MAMMWQQSNEYDSYMREGNWFLNRVEMYKKQGNYSEAKDNYFKAMEQFRCAYDLARSCDDYKQNKAYRLMNSARGNFSDIAYKDYDKGR